MPNFTKEVSKVGGRQLSTGTLLAIDSPEKSVRDITDATHADRHPIPPFFSKLSFQQLNRATSRQATS